MLSTAHPEEIECFRMPSGGFSQDKRYEYTYATRKSREYIPALRRQDWRYFTNKGFTYAGKWRRSEQRGWGDGVITGRCFLTTETAEENTVCCGIMMGHCVIGSSLLRNCVHNGRPERLTTREIDYI